MDWVMGPGGFDELPAAQREVMKANAGTLPPLLKLPSAQAPVTCEMVGRIQAPTLLLVGDRSQPYFRAIADEFARCLPGTQRMVLPGRHFLTHENPAAFNAALSGFLERYQGQ